MKKFLIKLLFFVMPLLFVISIPVSLLWSVGENYINIDSILKSNQKHLIGYAYNESNYKYIKWWVMSNKAKNNVVALGSSRVLQFREEMFDSSFYNAGYTINSISEFKPFLESIPKKNYPDYLIIGLDQWMFNKNYDKMEGKVPKKKWSNSFTKYASSKTIQSVSLDLFSGKYSFDIVNYKKDKFKIGLNAEINNKGMRNDGSMYYGSQITKLLDNDPTAKDFLYKNTFKDINKGINRFKYSKEVNQKSITELDYFLTFCKENKIFVIAFLPPFGGKAFNIMQKSHNYNYIDKIYSELQPTFEKYSFELYDYSSVDFCNSNDNETIDGFHGGELTYQRILIDILSQNSVLNNSTNISRLEKDLKKHVNRYVVYKY